MGGQALQQARDLAVKELSAAKAAAPITGRAANFAKVSFATDGIFSDGYSLEMTSLTGDATNGYTATITVGISV